MANWRNVVARMLGFKASQARIALSFNQLGQAISSPRNYESFSANGYEKNVIVYACISKIAEACGSLEWEAYKKSKGRQRTQLESSPVLDLLNRPNPMMARSTFIESVVGYYKLAGNTFIEGVGTKGSDVRQQPTELWPVRPDKMRIVAGPGGYPSAYVLEAGGEKRIWPVDRVDLKAMIMHMKSWHPRNDWWGLSPLEAGLIALDQSNSGQKWNLALLQNSATPSGVLQVVKSDVNPAGVLTPDQFERLKQQLDEDFTGYKNAGRPLLLEGGLSWEAISLSPKDMEFINNKNVTAIDLCMIYGVPPEILGLGQKTFRNYEEARLAFYQDTVLPIADKLKTEFNSWLCPLFDDTTELDYDKDNIEALAPARAAKYQTIKDAGFLTVNEKRAAAGYEAIDGGDVFIVGQSVVSDLSLLDLAGEDSVDEELGEEESNEDESNDMDSDDQGVDSDENDESGDEDEDEKSIQFKSFNLLNRNEKLSSARSQAWRKTRLARPFERDLASDFREMGRDLKKAASIDGDPKVKEFAILKAVDENIKTITATMKRHLKYSVEEFGEITFNNAKSQLGIVETKAANRKWDDWAKRYVETRTARAISQVEGTTRSKVRETVRRLVEQALIDGDSNADIAKELEDTFASISKSRARTIAVTEVQMASNNSSLNAVRSLQIPGMEKEWVHPDWEQNPRDGGPDGNDPDHVIISGMSIPIDEKFDVPPDATMDGPGDESGGPEQVINCRCALVFNSRGNDL